DPPNQPVGATRLWAHSPPGGGSAAGGVGAAPNGRRLSGIRGIRLEVTGVRAKFKYAGRHTGEVRERIAARLAARGGPGDPAALAHLLRRGTD
ncbi:FMN-binding negative transcriptional regulator, partial [Streptomyces sp. NPDC059378]